MAVRAYRADGTSGSQGDWSHQLYNASVQIGHEGPWVRIILKTDEGESRPGPYFPAFGGGYPDRYRFSLDGTSSTASAWGATIEMGNITNSGVDLYIQKRFLESDPVGADSCRATLILPQSGIITGIPDMSYVDTGVGDDTIPVGVVIPLAFTDTGGGGDDIPVTLSTGIIELPLTDSGEGSDTLSIGTVIPMIFVDSGVGSDDVPVGVTIPPADDFTPTQVLTVPAATFSTEDTSSHWWTPSYTVASSLPSPGAVGTVCGGTGQNGPGTGNYAVGEIDVPAGSRLYVTAYVYYGQGGGTGGWVAVPGTDGPCTIPASTWFYTAQNYQVVTDTSVSTGANAWITNIGGAAEFRTLKADAVAMAKGSTSGWKLMDPGENPAVLDWVSESSYVAGTISVNVRLVKVASDGTLTDLSSAVTTTPSAIASYSKTGPTDKPTAGTTISCSPVISAAADLTAGEAVGLKFTAGTYTLVLLTDDLVGPVKIWPGVCSVAAVLAWTYFTEGTQKYRLWAKVGPGSIGATVSRVDRVLW